MEIVSFISDMGMDWKTIAFVLKAGTLVTYLTLCIRVAWILID